MSGILRARILGDPGLTDEKVQEIADSYYNCTACRRCHFECPMGIDHALITHLGRYILSEIGIAPRALVVSVREQLIGASGNTSAIPLPALLDTLEFLSDDIHDEKGVPGSLPRRPGGSRVHLLSRRLRLHDGGGNPQGHRRGF